MAIFDKAALDYDDWYTNAKGNFVDKVETDLAFKLIDIKEGMKVLDVGCGTGNFSIKLANKGCDVTGIDISDEMLNIAIKKIAEQNLDIKFHNMDLYDMKFEDNSFDAVFSMAAFEFVEDATKALEELFRVVKKGGQIFIGTIARNSSWGELYQSKPFKDSVFKYAKFKTLEEMKSWNKEKLINYGECLFVPPLANDDDFNYETENKLSKATNGGFICALWEK